MQTFGYTIVMVGGEFHAPAIEYEILKHGSAVRTHNDYRAIIACPCVVYRHMDQYEVVKAAFGREY